MKELLITYSSRVKPFIQQILTEHLMLFLGPMYTLSKENNQIHFRRETGVPHKVLLMLRWEEQWGQARE